MSTVRLALLALAVLAVPAAAAVETHDDLTDQVRAAETAFARSMADRDLAAFTAFLADEAVFFGDGSVLRGKEAVVAAWSAYFVDDDAPFSWRSESVEVLPSGTLAHSSGPVLLTGGKQVGTFNSIWRREPDSRWKIVFDKGCSLCE